MLVAPIFSFEKEHSYYFYWKYKQ